MCKNCECEEEKAVQYKCNCNEKNCDCDQIIEFDKEPNVTPYCCGVEMKRIK